jgi:peptidoglycan hydrolase CwlO-like protein
MSYSVNLLSTVDDCDQVLTNANQEKDELLFRQTSLLREQKNLTNSSNEVSEDFQALTTEANALKTVIAALGEGTTKEENKKKLRRAEYRLSLVNDRKAHYNVVTILENEHDLALIQREIEEVDAYIAAITERKAAI